MGQRNIENELDLLPVISLLAVCISFLLLTSAWVHISALDVSQAIGSESENQVQPSLSISIDSKGLTFQVKDSAKISRTSKFFAFNRQGIHWQKIEFYTDLIIKKEPQLKLALISPSANSKYSDLIKLIDTFKTKGISDVGIAPL
ncbi:MAG: biopolymer transporter ExbD [Bdellovibrionales bacterium]|nr:biopolymer transporter ExbD [Bdellovibrionales bacterium]